MRCPDELEECSCGQEDPISGKPWIVYIHGGEWAECTNINEYYAMFASHIAAATQMGVLAVDFRTLQAVTPHDYLLGSGLHSAFFRSCQQ